MLAERKGTRLSFVLRPFSSGLAFVTTAYYSPLFYQPNLSAHLLSTHWLVQNAETDYIQLAVLGPVGSFCLHVFVK
jgi:hypothetical protein